MRMTCYVPRQDEERRDVIHWNTVRKEFNSYWQTRDCFHAKIYGWEKVKDYDHVIMCEYQNCNKL